MDATISLILTASDSPEAVEGFLKALGGGGLSWSEEGREIIVVSAFAMTAPPIGITWIQAAEGSVVPRLRRVGLDASRGSVVVFAEDSVRPCEGWLEAYRRAFLDPAVKSATGPSVYGSSKAAWDRAVFLFEYGDFALGIAPIVRPSGHNFAAVREVLANSGDELHEHELSLDGFRCADKAAVTHVRRYSPEEAVRDRFRFGRDYGARRWKGRFRPLGLVAIPGVAIVQGMRMFRLFTHRSLREFRPSWPALAVLVWAWSVGEGVGWLTARACGKRRGTPKGPASERPATGVRSCSWPL